MTAVAVEIAAMRVLLVEDDHRLATSLRRGLEEAGMSVDMMHDADDGLAAAMSTPYDVIVLDVMLPGMDGFEVSGKLRGQRVHTPILMLTGRDSIEDRVRGLNSGADDYMVKPFALRELVARIKALTRRHLPDRNADLKAGPIVLDTAGHLLKVDGKPVDLTAKEFAILELFMLHQGQLLSRDQIIDHVWNYDFEGGRNLIEVYMGRLRRKLTDAGSGDPFKTIRGSGYRFDPPGQ